MASRRTSRSRAEGALGVDGGGEAPGKRPKQAVVVIHGMGEQRPMSTLRGFVDAVWSHDLSLTWDNKGKRTKDPVTDKPVNRNWFVPDRRTASHELRRITTVADKENRRTDFYELYWADIVQGTTRGRLYAWMRELLIRRREEIPDDALLLYRATWVFAFVVALATLLLAASFFADWFGPATVAVLAVLASAVLWAVDHFVLPYFGDVAAYVQATPATVEQRARVRECGLALLKQLSDDDDYDRIVLVGHSLGSIIAYELLQILWAERRPRGLREQADARLLAAIRAVGDFAALPDDFPSRLSPPERQAFREAQWRLHTLLRQGGPARAPWKFSDFVSLGSPLTHAEFLLARNRDVFRQGATERLFALCPPLSDSEDNPEILYSENKAEEKLAVHHGATFAATRWTNIYDLGDLLATGDPFSGRMEENFGAGVAEFQVRIRRKVLGGWRRLFTHTHYWSLEAEGEEVAPGSKDDGRSHLAVLREALDLSRALEPAPGEAPPGRRKPRATLST